jgi:hypothetical protein
MRTVTFSDKKVAEAVKESFVATWTNRKPDFHNCQMATEEHILKTSPDCFATKNFTTFFCTPDKRVLHYFTGYYGPKLFLEELAFVKDLYEKSVDAKGKVNTQKFKELHGARAGERHTETAEVEESSRMPAKPEKGDNALDRFNAAQAAHSLAEGLKHLTEVSRAMSGKGMPTLDSALKEHLFGNQFTEEQSKPGWTKTK